MKNLATFMSTNINRVSTQQIIKYNKELKMQTKIKKNQ